MPAYTLATGKNRVLTGAGSHAPTLGRLADVFISLLPDGERIAPVQQALTISAGGGSGATLTVTETISANMQAGQYLMFTDPATGLEYLVKISTAVNSGSDIEIEVAVAGDIPDGAISQFPNYLWDRSDANVSRSYNRAVTPTYNTGGDEDGVITGASRTIALPGIYYNKNAGYMTALNAANLGREVWVQRQIGDSLIDGAAVVTAANSPAPVGGNVGADLTLAFQGAPNEVLSAAG